MFYLDHTCCSYDDDCWKTGCGGWVISAITASLANHQNKVDQDFLFCLQENHTTGKYIFNNLLNGLREGVPKKSFCSFGFCSNERGGGLVDCPTQLTLVTTNSSEKLRNMKEHSREIC